MKRRRGTYGLALRGLDSAAVLEPVPASAPELVIEVDVAATSDERSQVSASSADLLLRGGGRLLMRRGDARARYTFAQPPGVDELVHPYLAPAAALAQLWNGREAFHAGAFAGRDGAVLLLGGKGDGKSTTLAWIAAAHGLPVLADDLAVIEDGAVLAGPRCLDVRAGAGVTPEQLATARHVRGGDRLRIGLEPAPARSPLAAVVLLGWGPRVGLDPVSVDERLPALVEQRMFYVRMTPDPLVLLALAGLPTVRLTRPRGDRGLAEGVSALVDRFG